jgi:hypothetical protein
LTGATRSVSTALIKRVVEQRSGATHERRAAKEASMTPLIVRLYVNDPLGRR